MDIEQIIVSERFLKTLRLSRRLVFVLNLLVRIFLVLTILGLALKYFVFFDRVGRIHPLMTLFEVLHMIAMFVASLGIARYSRGLKKFLAAKDRTHLQALIWSYRSMWTKLAITSLLLLTVVCANLVNLILTPPFQINAEEIREKVEQLHDQ